MGMLAALPAWAQTPGEGPRDLPTDPEEILESCLDHVHAAADRCAEQIGQMTERCLGAIAEALEAGETRKAVHIGRTCLRRVHQNAHQCVGHINRACRRCAAAMENNGATEEQLARLMAGCEAAKEEVRQAATRAAEAIRDALPERPDGPDDEGGSGTDV